ncbi:hypothetical protein GCM10009672_16440 [Nesterenkonia lutea]
MAVAQVQKSNTFDQYFPGSVRLVADDMKLRRSPVERRSLLESETGPMDSSSPQLRGVTPVPLGMTQFRAERLPLDATLAVGGRVEFKPFRGNKHRALGLVAVLVTVRRNRKPHHA